MGVLEGKQVSRDSGCANELEDEDEFEYEADYDDEDEDDDEENDDGEIGDDENDDEQQTEPMDTGDSHHDGDNAGIENNRPTRGNNNQIDNGPEYNNESSTDEQEFDDSHILEQSRRMQQADGSSDGHDNHCTICNKEGELICCDNCHRTYHRTCTTPELTTFPEGEWFCPCCTTFKQYKAECDKGRKEMFVTYPMDLSANNPLPYEMYLVKDIIDKKQENGAIRYQAKLVKYLRANTSMANTRNNRQGGQEYYESLDATSNITTLLDDLDNLDGPFVAPEKRPSFRVKDARGKPTGPERKVIAITDAQQRSIPVMRAKRGIKDRPQSDRRQRKRQKTHHGIHNEPVVDASEYSTGR